MIRIIIFSTTATGTSLLFRSLFPVLRLLDFSVYRSQLQVLRPRLPRASTGHIDPDEMSERSARPSHSVAGAPTLSTPLSSEIGEKISAYPSPAPSSPRCGDQHNEHNHKSPGEIADRTEIERAPDYTGKAMSQGYPRPTNLDVGTAGENAATVSSPRLAKTAMGCGGAGPGPAGAGNPRSHQTIVGTTEAEGNSWKIIHVMRNNHVHVGVDSAAGELREDLREGDDKGRAEGVVKDDAELRGKSKAEGRSTPAVAEERERCILRGIRSHDSPTGRRSGGSNSSSSSSGGSARRRGESVEQKAATLNQRESRIQRESPAPGHRSVAVLFTT